MRLSCFRSVFLSRCENAFRPSEASKRYLNLRPPLVSSDSRVRRERRWSTAGVYPPGNWFAPPGSNQSSSGGNQPPYLGTVPSKKRVIHICEVISEMTGRDETLLDQGMVGGKLNRTMIGWANFFCLGPVSKSYRAVERHACKRLRQWLCAKHKEVWPGTKRFPEGSLHEVLGLVRLTKR